jgi:hypothetical protein
MATRFPDLVRVFNNGNRGTCAVFDEFVLPTLNPAVDGYDLRGLACRFVVPRKGKPRRCRHGVCLRDPRTDTSQASRQWCASTTKTAARRTSRRASWRRVQTKACARTSATSSTAACRARHPAASSGTRSRAHGTSSLHARRGSAPSCRMCRHLHTCTNTFAQLSPLRQRRVEAGHTRGLRPLRSLRLLGVHRRRAVAQNWRSVQLALDRCN